MLVHGLIASSSMMVYSLFLLTLIIYVFGLLGVELITFKYMDQPDVDPRLEEIIQEFFPNLAVTMLNLSRFVTLDGIGAIYIPLITLDPWLAPYFISLILVVGIVLMNLITAVLVQSALEQAASNKEAEGMLKEKEKKKLMKKLRNMFKRFDADDTGYVDISKVLHAPPEDLAYFLEYSKSVDPVTVFHHLDTDGSGSLDINEFCEGLHTALLSKNPIELTAIHKRVETILNNSNRNMEVMDGMSEALANLVPSVRQLRRSRATGGQPYGSNRQMNWSRQCSQDSRPWSRTVSNNSQFQKGYVPESPTSPLAHVSERTEGTEIGMVQWLQQENPKNLGQYLSNKVKKPRHESAATTSKPSDIQNGRLGHTLPSAGEFSSMQPRQPGISPGSRRPANLCLKLDTGPPRQLGPSTTPTPASTFNDHNKSEWESIPVDDAEKSPNTLPPPDSEGYGSGDFRPGQQWAVGNGNPVQL